MIKLRSTIGIALLLVGSATGTRVKSIQAPATALCLLLTTRPVDAQVPRWTVPAPVRATAEELALEEFDDLQIAPDKSIYVPQSAAGQMVIVSPGGRVSVLGRNGRGPGEFESIREFGWIGDSLWVSDPRQARVSWFQKENVFSNADRYAVSPDGDRFYTIAASGTPTRRREYTDTAFGSDGSVARTRSFPYVPRAIPKRAMDEMVSAMTQVFARVEKSARIEAEVRRRLSETKFYPPWKNAVVGSDGELWLEPHATTGSTTNTWTIIGADGRIKATTTLPRGYRLRAVRGNLIAGFTVSDLDEPLVVLYRLDRSIQR